MKRMLFEVHGGHLFSHTVTLVEYCFFFCLALTVSPALVVVAPISRTTTS